jgi:hypothetical protein
MGSCIGVFDRNRTLGINYCMFHYSKPFRLTGQGGSCIDWAAPGLLDCMNWAVESQRKFCPDPGRRVNFG